MEDGVRFAVTEEELRAAYQLRYKVYVELMGKYKDKANHELKELRDEDDEHAKVVIAIKDGEAVGTLRLLWGGNMHFSPSIVEIYSLEPFLKKIEERQICVVERLMVDERHRGSSATLRMYKEVMQFVLKNEVEAVFLDCEPHQLNPYMKLGFRPFAKTCSYPGVGLAIPMVLISGDYQHLQSVGSPFALLASETDLEHYRYVNELHKIIDNNKIVISQAISDQAEFIRQIYADARLFENNNPKAFDTLTEEEVERVIEKSHIIECSLEDRIIAKNNAQKTMFVVLSGMVEVYREDKLLAVIYPGEVIGEVAYFLKRPRSANIIAATNDVRLLSLDEPSMSRLLKFEPVLANKILTNLCRVLCSRLIGGVETSDLRSN